MEARILFDFEMLHLLFFNFFYSVLQNPTRTSSEDQYLNLRTNNIQVIAAEFHLNKRSCSCSVSVSFLMCIALDKASLTT